MGISPNRFGFLKPDSMLFEVGFVLGVFHSNRIKDTVF
jgi:hypothetical protein